MMLDLFPHDWGAIGKGSVLIGQSAQEMVVDCRELVSASVPVQCTLVFPDVVLVCILMWAAFLTPPSEPCQ